ncbi:MAG: hypothetical protein DRP96_12745, partial [Candidatus Neomarinimicrobiota bacterium]
MVLSISIGRMSGWRVVFPMSRYAPDWRISAAFRITARTTPKPSRQYYNHERPHSSLGYQTPSEYKAAWADAQPGALP